MARKRQRTSCDGFTRCATLLCTALLPWMLDRVSTADGLVAFIPARVDARHAAQSRAQTMLHRRSLFAVGCSVAAADADDGLAVGGWSGTNLKVRSVAEAAAFLQANHARRYEMARYPDPVLRSVAAQVTSFSPELEVVAAALQSTAAKEGAVGLAANQAGVNASVIVLDPNLVGQDVPRVLVNPRIVARTPEEEMRFWRELCLVLPSDVRVTLMRDSGITVEFMDLRGNHCKQKFDGEAARAFQHEFDHLNGVLILDHALDPVDLQSAVFPAMWDLEKFDHAWRQAKAFARDV